MQSKTLIFLCQIVLVAVLVIACHGITKTNDVSIPSASTTPFSNTNVPQGCIETYNPEIDYFPEKVSVNYAKGFIVEYHKNYKIVTVKNPWRNADTTFQYVLVQCGTPVPKGFRESQIIQVPINTIVSLSTTHLPHLDMLGVVDKLLGVSDAERINTDRIAQEIKEGKVAKLGNSTNVNLEKILELNPDLVTTYGSGNSTIDSYPKLLELGLKVAINAEYMESSPLGQAEWLKFTSLFFNREAKAEKLFGEIAQQYEAISTQAKAVKKRPTVFVGFNFKGTWYMPGGKSYVAQYLADAGANYLWKDNELSGTIPLSFEKVFERAANADYWLNGSQSWKTKKDLLAEDSRYADFKAVKNGQIYNNNARLNSSDGNDYWESGISNPHVVLSDLIQILHPEVLSDRTLKYYRKLS
ncbi:ABC transporter substrate-binding protein [Scytonema sp. NUACC21]